MESSSAKRSYEEDFAGEHITKVARLDLDDLIPIPTPQPRRQYDGEAKEAYGKGYTAGYLAGKRSASSSPNASPRSSPKTSPRSTSKPNPWQQPAQDDEDEEEEEPNFEHSQVFKKMDSRVATEIKSTLKKEGIDMTLKEAYQHTRLYRMGQKEKIKIPAKPRTVTELQGASRVQSLRQTFPAEYERLVKEVRVSTKNRVQSTGCIEYGTIDGAEPWRRTNGRPQISATSTLTDWDYKVQGSTAFLRALLIGFDEADEKLQNLDLTSYEASHLCHNKWCVNARHIKLEISDDHKRRKPCETAKLCMCGQGCYPK